MRWSEGNDVDVVMQPLATSDLMTVFQKKDQLPDCGWSQVTEAWESKASDEGVGACVYYRFIGGWR